MTRRFASEILPLIGPDQDIPAPDVYTDSQTMAWIMDTYSMMQGHNPCRESLPENPISIGDSLGRAESDGSRPHVCCGRSCKLKKIPLRGASVAIQGFGNAGATAARLLFEKKGKNCCAQRYSGRRDQSARNRSYQSIAI